MSNRYNRVGSSYSCETEGTLVSDLKGKMGFRGFVQSDWGATHSTAVGAGLDMEMPMAADLGAGGDRYWYSAARLSRANATDVDGAAMRVVAAMVRMNVSARRATLARSATLRSSALLPAS